MLSELSPGVVWPHAVWTAVLGEGAAWVSDKQLTAQSSMILSGRIHRTGFQKLLGDSTEAEGTVFAFRQRYYSVKVKTHRNFKNRLCRDVTFAQTSGTL